jgi:hypothetical protein
LTSANRAKVTPETGTEYVTVHATVEAVEGFALARTILEHVGATTGGGTGAEIV